MDMLFIKVFWNIEQVNVNKLISVSASTLRGQNSKPSTGDNESRSAEENSPFSQLLSHSRWSASCKHVTYGRLQASLQTDN